MDDSFRVHLQSLEAVFEERKAEVETLRTENERLKMECVSRHNAEQSALEQLAAIKTEFERIQKENHRLARNVLTLRRENERLHTAKSSPHQPPKRRPSESSQKSSKRSQSRLSRSSVDSRRLFVEQIDDELKRKMALFEAEDERKIREVMELAQSKSRVPSPSRSEVSPSRAATPTLRPHCCCETPGPYESRCLLHNCVVPPRSPPSPQPEDSAQQQQQQQQPRATRSAAAAIGRLFGR